MLPPLSEGLVIGKIEKKYSDDLPGEVLIEPLELGTPGAYVARVASWVLTAEELDKLKALGDGATTAFGGTTKLVTRGCCVNDWVRKEI